MAAAFRPPIEHGESSLKLMKDVLQSDDAEKLADLKRGWDTVEIRMMS